ncbi:hypothetical protein [Dactylosporangium sp. CS-033363]|uniref:hypothetical protein n=1 Tax=Dactylosporangium sp. CS-033363 TaxID=3239935 RepID=UPI003D945678
MTLLALLGMASHVLIGWDVRRLARLKAAGVPTMGRPGGTVFIAVCAALCTGLVALILYQDATWAEQEAAPTGYGLFGTLAPLDLQNHVQLQRLYAGIDADDPPSSEEQATRCLRQVVDYNLLADLQGPPAGYPLHVGDTPTTDCV